MSISSEITRISNNIAAAYTALDEKGATLPESQNSANLADTIASVPSGGGGGGTEDFDRAAFYSKIEEMNNILITRDEEYNPGRMERALQNGFIEKKSSSGDQDPDWFYILQLRYDTKCITFQARNSTDSIAFWCPSECNVYTSDGLGRVTNTSDTSEKRVTIEFTGDEDRTVIIGVRTVNSNNLTLGLYSVFSSLNAPTGGKDLTPYIRACHVYLPYHEKRRTDATHGSLLNTYSFSHILGSAKIFSFEKPNNTWNKLENDTVWDLSNFNNSLDDTSVFAEVYSSNFFDAELGVFKLPSDYLSSFKSNLSRYMQVYSHGSGNGLFPFIVDFSSYTNSSEITFGGYTQLTSTASAAAQLTTMYIKLPSTANVNMGVYDGGATNAFSSLQLTYKSWQYLAENAPSVTGKTLKVGYQFYNLAKTLQVPSYKAITDTLEGKGWTVSAN